MLLPQSDWQVPTDLPDLRRVGVVAIDTETNDEGLRADRGSGWPWGGGHICGISVAYRADGEIRAHYFPLRHPDTDNFDAARVYDWLKDLTASNVSFVTQNGLYDWGWLRAEAGIKMPPSDRLEEIGALATLVDENRFSYSLDALCAWRGLPGKDTALLQQAIKSAGFAPKRKKINAQAHIWQLPARFVGPYAEADPINTLLLFESLNPILDREGTRDAYRLEIDLLPMVHEMRRRGIRIDQTAAEQARDLILRKRGDVLAELSEKLGTRVSMDEIGSPKWKAETFDRHNIAYPRTTKGNPSFKGGKTGWMVTDPHWLPPLIARATKYDITATRFLESHILGHIINGRVYSEIHPHRSDDGGGTCSLRFSYSEPPLQQMPSRDKELAPSVRGVFLPEEGEVWAKPDISQQEFRFVVHHAVLRDIPRAKEAAELYRTNPDADFHAMVANMTGIERDSAKAVNFAKIFGAGPDKFAEMIGKPPREARALYHQYDQKLPFISRLSNICQREAKQLGYTELYDGARRHWDRWEAPGIYVKGAGPCSREEAQHRIEDPQHPWFGRWLRQAKTHTAMNALIQGSAARHTKLWMRACWREGIVPLLQMHDALECSVTTREQGELVARLGCEAVQLEVPMRVDLKFGRSWGDAKHTWEELTGSTPAPKPAPAPEPIQSPCDEGSQEPSQFHIAPVQTMPALEQEPEDIEEPKAPFLADLVGEPLIGGKICCPFHDDRTPSLHIYEDHFHCFGCGAHGDNIDWLMMVERLNREQAIHRLETWDGHSIARLRAPNTEKTRASALRLWGQAQPIAGTLAARYLADIRGIELAALPDNIDAVLRFHPRCPFGPGTQHPCLIALLRNIATDQPTGIHRIALTPDGGKIGRMQLGSWGPVKLWPAGSQLVIGEGIETVLAAATRFSYGDAPLQPAWSAISNGSLGKFPVLPDVKQLIILTDHDANGVGQAAAERCRERWLRTGRDVVRLMTGAPDTDFNNLTMPEPMP